MEVTVLETGDLPANTFISFHTGTIRRQAQVEKNKAINLSHVAGLEPVRVDLMAQVGSHTFEMVPGQDIYDVPIKAAQADESEVKLKFQIRDAKAAGKGKKEGADASGSDGAAAGKDGEYEPASPVSPSRKLHTALTMRSYLDTHDVLQKMQELLNGMVTKRPEDPIEYMISRLEEVCQESYDVDVEVLDDQQKAAEVKPADAQKEPEKEEKKEEAKKDDSEEEDDDDDVGDMAELTPMPQKARGRSASVSAEAYGAYNQRKAYQPKKIAKDDSQKERLQKILRECWMFKDYTPENLNVVIDAMAERVKPSDVQLIQQGDEGNAMWVIEEGVLECTKKINGEEKVVKTCTKGDVFGELALLYSCPRAASVFSREKCILWELDRETFRAICYEAAQSAGVPQYEGFSAPGSASKEPEKEEEKKQEAKKDDSEEEDDDDDVGDMAELTPMPQKARGRSASVSAEAYGAYNQRKAYQPKKIAKDDSQKERLQKILRECWMFKDYTPENLNVVIDAMAERVKPSDVQLIQQGDEGNAMWVIEEGVLECTKKINGEEKVVKTCTKGDVFGELALLYSCPRAASVFSREKCILWELDRETFRAICYEAAQSAGVPQYEGFSAPGSSSKEPEKEEDKKEEPEKEEAKKDDSEEEDDDDDDVGDMAELTPMPQKARGRSASVSAEAYGAYNQRKAYKPIKIAKDDTQKERLQKILSQCWMFKDYTPESLNVVIDAMAEKVQPANIQLIQQGDEGNAMWVIEEGILECTKKIDGEEKVVKTCTMGDVFGELALLYSCPRAASVFTREKCVLWELDRETFRAICYEAAQKSGISYEGFSAPGGESTETKEEEEEVPQKPVKSKGKRREGVSAEAMQGDGADYTPPVHPKTDEERKQLEKTLKTSHDAKLLMLFGTVNNKTFDKIIDATFSKKIAKGEHVIEQGDVGDFFYIVRSGKFDIFVQPKGEPAPKKVFEAEEGFAFGELALLYNAPRSATITASEESEVWCLDRTAFRNLVVRSAEAQFKEYVEFLNGVDIFQVLSSDERASLAEVLEEEEFEEDEAIVEQGERDDKMFILRKGAAVACIKGDQGEVEVMKYGQGDYFGEIALILGEPRKASVYAVQACTCLYITHETFVRILGPLHSLLERNVGKYEKYADAISAAEVEEKKQANVQKRGSVQVEGELEEFQGGRMPGVKTHKMANRKRDRNDEKMEEVKESSKHPQEIEPEEPGSLADKVALDFKNPKLVEPQDQFKVPSLFTMFGGLILGQKFTMDKKLHFRGCSDPVASGEDSVFAWNQTTKQEKNTEIAVMCQKGQKSASDPTPNQDNFFVHSVGSVEMYGVADGHGPFGHLVSFRLVQTLPYLLTNNPNFGKDWSLVLNEAFLAAQKDMIEFCEAENINIEASGAACSVLVLEEQTVHVAFVGDARIMLGSWNRRDSRMIFCTEDHKPEKDGERQRLEAAGSEVREVDPGNFRIYLPGSTFPGLTMSRAMGDTACAGVLQEPEYHRFLMQPKDEWYAIVGSDGIWEFIKGEEACSMTAKKLRLKGARETANFIVNSARKRWAYCCGDYCDDITGIIVQWNSHERKSEAGNHSLTAKQPKE